MSVCLKQHGLESALQLLGQSATSSSGEGDSSGRTDEMEEQCSLLDAVFTRINGLERRLQVRVLFVMHIHVHTHHVHIFLSHTHTLSLSQGTSRAGKELVDRC